MPVDHMTIKKAVAASMKLAALNHGLNADELSHVANITRKDAQTILPFLKKYHEKDMHATWAKGGNNGH